MTKHRLPPSLGLWVLGFVFPKLAVPSGSVAHLRRAASLGSPPTLLEVSSDPAQPPLWADSFRKLCAWPCPRY